MWRRVRRWPCMSIASSIQQADHVRHLRLRRPQSPCGRLGGMCWRLRCWGACYWGWAASWCWVTICRDDFHSGKRQSFSRSDLASHSESFWRPSSSGNGRAVSRWLSWAGGGRPRRWRSALGVLLGGLYLWGSYFGAQYVLPGENVLAFTWTRLALAPLGIFMAIAEEVMMRGFFMTELNRARVPTWLQILSSGAARPSITRCKIRRWRAFCRRSFCSRCMPGCTSPVAAA